MPVAILGNGKVAGVRFIKTKVENGKVIVIPTVITWFDSNIPTVPILKKGTWKHQTYTHEQYCELEFIQCIH